jgi:hypothetical protein
VNLQHVQWLSGSSELADLNLLLFFEMNEPVCFKVSLPALFSLHERWGVGHGKEADKIKRTFKSDFFSPVFFFCSPSPR